MTPAQIIKEAFRGFPFGQPCTPANIARAEHDLESLPEELREFYRMFDGFHGPTDAHFFWSLFEKNGLVDFNRFLRSGDEFPHRFVSSCLFFGDAGIGDMWGIKRDLPGKVVRWDASWGEDFQIAGESLVEVWLAEKKTFDGLKKKKRA